MNIGFRIIHYKFSKLSRFRNMFNIQHNTGSLGDKIGKAKNLPSGWKNFKENRAHFPLFVDLEAGITLNKNL